MKKRILALALAVMTTLMLAGCGKAQETVGGKEEEVKQETQEAAPEETATAEPECVHEWVEATYAAPKTCKLCGETEGEPKQSYFAQYGVDVPDGPVDCTVDYIYYNKEDPETYCRVGDAVCTQTDCYAEPADEEGYQNVHLTLTVTLQPGCYYDAAEDVKYLRQTYYEGIYDWYTGRMLPVRDMSGDDAQEYAVTLDIDGASYEVSYSAEISWEQGEWVRDEAGNGTSSMTATKEYIFRIPEGYDGLVYCAIPRREYSGGIDTETVNGLDEAKYIPLDPSDEDYVEGMQYFRINRTEIPVREAEADTEDAAETEASE